MTESWWDRLSLTLERVVDAPADARAELLDSLCEDDPALRQEVESLVAAYERENDRFAAPAAHLLAAAPDPIAPDRQVGPYLVVREIGRGGMGSVFEAYRADDDFRKRVALKTLWIGQGNAAVVGRFRRERRILARLDHPNIAALLDGGVLPGDVPYFAMEYVEGEPIDSYCASHALSLADRIELIRQVCGAVQFAHQNLVVHRDLKPGNILVTADGTVKLLDFGIAKLLSAEADTGGPDMTEVGGAPYTTAYASPEQLRGDPVTTASDIHALGIVLYQLLTGRHPFRDAETASAEVRRRILEQPAPPAGMGSDLDAIIAVALRKEPARRYSSAEQFADDLLRFRRGLTVRARPDTVGYRMAKFVRRNRVVVGASALTVVALASATLVSREQALVAARERDRARLEAERANQVAAFVQEILRGADPRQAGPGLTVADALDAATLHADSILADQPDILASVLTAIGLSHLGLGAYDAAEPPLRQALELRRSVGPLAETAASLRNLALLYSERGEIEPAERLFLESLDAFRGLSPPDSAGLAATLNDLGDLLQYKGDLAGALTVQREALALRIDVEGPRGAGVAASLNNIAVIEGQLGNWPQAEQLGRQALEIITEQVGPRHPDVGSGLNALAFAVQSQRRYAEADSLYRAALAIRLEALGPEHPETARTYMNLGWLLHDAGRYDEALVEADRVLALRGPILPDDHPAIGSTLTLRGQTLMAIGSSAEAEESLRDALALREASLPPGHWLIASSQSAVAEALIATRRFGEAEDLLLEALAVLRAERGEDQELTVLARERLVRLYEAWGRSEEAGRYRAGQPAGGG